MKVILDFQNLDESSDNEGFLQSLTEYAKEATGYLFCYINKDRTGGQQIYSLNAPELATIVDSIERSHPEVRMIRMMRKLRGGG